MKKVILILVVIGFGISANAQSPKTPLDVVNEMIRCAKNNDKNGLLAHFAPRHESEWWSFNSWVGNKDTYDVSVYNLQYSQDNSIVDLEVHCKSKMEISIYGDYAHFLTVFDIKLRKQKKNGQWEWKVINCTLSQSKSKKW